MRVFFVTNIYPCRGRPWYGAFVRQQVAQLRRFVHVIGVINIPGFRSRLNYLRGAFEVLRKTSKVSHDVLHAHYGVSAFPAWVRLRAPLFITFHGSDVLLPGMFHRFWGRIASHLAGAVIVVSEEMQRRIPGEVIPCGVVDLSVFRPYDRHAARLRLRWSDHKYLGLFPFDPQGPLKRYDLANAAVERLATDGPDVKLVVVFRVENQQMPWYYSAADAMILCSDSEGSPTSVKEALACNLSVVASDVGDNREIMRGIQGTRICTSKFTDRRRCSRLSGGCSDSRGSRSRCIRWALARNA